MYTFPLCDTIKINGNPTFFLFLVYIGMISLELELTSWSSIYFLLRVSLLQRMEIGQIGVRGRPVQRLVVEGHTPEAEPVLIPHQHVMACHVVDRVLSRETVIL